jgi:hypothetical protein
MTKNLMTTHPFPPSLPGTFIARFQKTTLLQTSLKELWWRKANRETRQIRERDFVFDFRVVRVVRG